MPARTRAADDPVADLPDDIDRFRGGALLGAHLHHVSVPALGLDEKLALARIVAARLLDVDVLARLQAEQGRRRVSVVGCGDDQRIEGRIVQGPPEVRDARRAVLLARAHRGDGLLDGTGIHVADPRHVRTHARTRWPARSPDGSRPT